MKKGDIAFLHTENSVCESLEGRSREVRMSQSSVSPNNSNKLKDEKVQYLVLEFEKNALELDKDVHFSVRPLISR